MPQANGRVTNVKTALDFWLPRFLPSTQFEFNRFILDKEALELFASWPLRLLSGLFVEILKWIYKRLES